MGFPSSADGSLREPSTTLWKVLKIVFLIMNVIATISAVLMIILCVGFAAITSGKVQLDGHSPTDDQVYAAKIILAVFIPLVFLQIVMVVVGFIGICRLHLGCLYAYTVITFISALLSLVAALMGAVNVGLFSNIGVFLMMYFLIRELKRENGIV